MAWRYRVSASSVLISPHGQRYELHITDSFVLFYIYIIVIFFIFFVSLLISCFIFFCICSLTIFVKNMRIEKPLYRTPLC